jgi:hypothetical protein
MRSVEFVDENGNNLSGKKRRTATEKSEEGPDAPSNEEKRHVSFSGEVIECSYKEPEADVFSTDDLSSADECFLTEELRIPLGVSYYKFEDVDSQIAPSDERGGQKNSPVHIDFGDNRAAALSSNKSKGTRFLAVEEAPEEDAVDRPSLVSSCFIICTVGLLTVLMPGLMNGLPWDACEEISGPRILWDAILLISGVLGSLLYRTETGDLSYRTGESGSNKWGTVFCLLLLGLVEMELPSREMGSHRLDFCLLVLGALFVLVREGLCAVLQLVLAAKSVFLRTTELLLVLLLAFLPFLLDALKWHCKFGPVSYFLSLVFTDLLAMCLLLLLIERSKKDYKPFWMSPDKLSIAIGSMIVFLYTFWISYHSLIYDYAPGFLGCILAPGFFISALPVVMFGLSVVSSLIARRHSRRRSKNVIRLSVLLLLGPVAFVAVFLLSTNSIGLLRAAA